MQSSFLLSAYISLIRPIDNRSKSAIDKPSCTHRRRNNGVVISRSVGRSFFSLNIRLHIQSPEFNELWKHLINGKGIEPIQPLFRCIWNTCVCMFCHDKGNILKHLQRKHVQIGASLAVISNGFFQCFQVFVNIPLELR